MAGICLCAFGGHSFWGRKLHKQKSPEQSGQCAFSSFFSLSTLACFKMISGGDGSAGHGAAGRGGVPPSLGDGFDDRIRPALPAGLGFDAEYRDLAMAISRDILTRK